MTKQGGGALCEHSHALNLLQFFMNDKIRKFNKNLIYYNKKIITTPNSAAYLIQIHVMENSIKILRPSCGKTVEIFQKKNI